MKIKSKLLIDDLIERTRQNLNRAGGLQELSTKQLNQRPGPGKWSAFECVEHLNRYGRFYLPEIKKRLKQGQRRTAREVFKSGLLGNYFAKSMLPGKSPMKTFSEMNPLGSELNLGVLEEFIHQQKEMLDLLQGSRMVNIQKVKTSISISKFIKLRLGDTYRVVIYHNQRHLLQAEKAADVL